MGSLRETVLDKPLNALLLVIVVFMVTSACLLIIGTLSGWVRKELEVILLVFGVLSVLIVVLRTENAIAITIAVLIIGTVVAGERFLLSVTALVGGASEEGRQFVTDVYGSQRAQARPQPDADELARLIVEEINKKDESEGKVELAVASFIREARVQELADEVRVEGAQIPLLRLLDEDGWRAFALEFASVPVFREDMATLRDLGLAVFENQVYEGAELTQLGRRVANTLNESPLERAVNRQKLERDGPIDSVDAGRFLQAVVGGPSVEVELADSATAWFSFDIPSDGSYRIYTEKADNEIFFDSVLTVYDSAKTEITSNDDFGDSLLSSVTVKLNKGEYFARVDDFDGRRARFRFAVTSED